jgi:hypothetical protein
MPGYPCCCTDVGPGPGDCDALFSWVVIPDTFTVDFTDESQADEPILEWAWDFGDEGTSIEQNPTHSYAEPGIYLVTLTITTATLECSIGQFVEVSIAIPPCCPNRTRPLPYTLYLHITTDCEPFEGRWPMYFDNDAVDELVWKTGPISGCDASIVHGALDWEAEFRQCRSVFGFFLLDIGLEGLGSGGYSFTIVSCDPLDLVLDTGDSDFPNAWEIPCGCSDTDRLSFRVTET